MTFKEYQEQAIKCAVYPNKGSNISYPMLGLIGETGEVAEKIKKMIRDDDGILTPQRSTAIKKELGDVLWYTQAVCYELRIYPRINLSEMPIVVTTGFENLLFQLLEEVFRVSKESMTIALAGEKIYDALVNILDCLNKLSELVGTNLNVVAQENLDKLFDRLERGVIKGDGDNR